MEKTFLSLVTPAFNEAENLPVLYDRLSKILKALNLEWEWLIIDDHSADDTFGVITYLAKQDTRVHGIRLSRNFGSHMAITCGLQRAKGTGVIIMAADLQDPPETLPALLEKWRNGAQVVWAVRRLREGEKSSKVGFSRLYYFLMRRITGIKDIPATGADFFLVDRTVVNAFREFSERNVSIMALITWMGFRQDYIYYDKQARKFGRSGWDLRKKLKLVVDSMTSFTYLPVRLMSYLGFFVALMGLVYAAVVIINALRGNPVQGWSSLMLVVLVIGGFQMIMMGILGEYLWRSLDESRRRPPYLIEAVTDFRSNSSDTDNKTDREIGNI
ncbi:MAG: glycosyltransferase family 2 protein [Deltaproteobacteria bacterium]|nr:glycosyltransferase family 2 protein [Deltaproteobacteria bacterium]